MKPPIAATLGVFDGVHRGHRAVLARARTLADRAGARLTAFTFDRPPQSVLAGEGPLPLLTSNPEKVALLRELGADEVRVLRFTPAFSEKDPERFLAEHVFPFGRLASLTVGYDFAMGHARQGTVDVLRDLGRRRGFAVHEVPPLLDGEEPISSTRIRRALAEGRVEDAARWLGRPYRISGTVVAGEGRGRGLGFPTANFHLDPMRARPMGGVYAVRVHGVEGSLRPGVANLGVRPTFGGAGERLEVHLLDADLDLVGRTLAVAFVARLRSEIKFNGAAELQRQVQEDARRARDLLASGLASQESP